MKELKVKSGDSLFFKLVFRTLLNIYDDVFSKIQHIDILQSPNCAFQKQPSTGVIRRRCSDNMQQIYRITHMPKSYFKKVAKQLYRNHTLYIS